MRRIFQVTSLFCLLALSGCSLHAQVNKVSKSNQVEPDQKVAQREQSRGVMSADDFQHFTSLGSKNTRKEPLSDNDIDWCIGMIHKPSKRPNELQATALAVFFDDKNMTPAQKTKVRGVVEPLLSSKSTLVRTTAQLAMKRLR
jgi:hypothetical protein